MKIGDLIAYDNVRNDDLYGTAMWSEPPIALDLPATTHNMRTLIGALMDDEVAIALAFMDTWVLALTNSYIGWIKLSKVRKI